MFVADIFVSYTSTDRQAAYWLALELEAIGHTFHVHEWEIRGGDDIYDWMQRRHDAADRVLCVVSDEYMRAPYSTLERNAALWQAVSKRPGFVLLVQVAPCKLPTLSDHIRRCDLVGLPETTARQRLREFLEGTLKPDRVAYFQSPAAVSNVPIRVPTHFMGREDSLAVISAALRRRKSCVAITTLHGLRGVGKTILAAAYADRHRDAYRATWWIRAQSDLAIRADIAALGVRLGWIAADAKEDPALAMTMDRLRHEGDGILLIYDNANDANHLAPYLPCGGRAHVLITSNAPAWRGIAETIQIQLWPTSIGADYLVQRTGRYNERSAAETLSDLLGGLPLAHEQAAAYCEQLDICFSEYTIRFNAAPIAMLDKDRYAPAEFHDGLTVAKAFALAIAAAGKRQPAAESLIQHLALLAPEPIPLFLLQEGRTTFADPLTSALDGDGLDEALSALRAFALLDRATIEDERDSEVKTDTIRLHRLVREVAASRITASARAEARHALVSVLATIYPEAVYYDPQTWPRARRLDALSMELVGGESELPNGVELLASRLLDRLASYRHSALAAYTLAHPLYERALALREKMLGLYHRDTATSLNNFAVLLQAEGDLSGARTLNERALAVREKVLGPDDTATATSLSNLASILQVQGDLLGARPFFERALAIRENKLGPHHPDTATGLNNLAVLMRGQGDLSSARPLLERALVICEKTLPPDHPDTATSMVNLADLLQAQGDLSGAHLLFKRALAIDEKVFGPDHPNTASSLGKLANLLAQQGNLSRALPLFQRALAICETKLVPHHPETAMALNNLGSALQAQNDLVGARPLFERALAIREKIFGPDHYETAASLNNLASLLQAQSDFPGARPLFQRALTINEKAFGPEHRKVAQSLGNLAGLLQAQGDPLGARLLLERVLAIHEKTLGPRHATTNRCCFWLARLFLEAGLPLKAASLANRALAAHENALGAAHPWTKDAARAAADSCNALGHHEQASAVRKHCNLA